MALLVTVGLLTSCGVEKVEIDELVDQQESFAASSRAENVVISGVITDPGNFGLVTRRPVPVEGATVQIGSASTTTDENGAFSITLEDTGPGAVVKISQEGHVDLTFPVSFRGYADNAAVSWTISLPETQVTIPFTPGAAASAIFVYLNVPYTVNVPEDASTQAIDISVSPSGTVIGPGISGVFAVTGIHVETPEENFIFDESISVLYDPIEAGLSGGVGAINPAAALPGAPPEAAEAAREVVDALAAGLNAISAGATPEEAAMAYIEELYDGSDEISVDADGNTIVVNTIEGSIYLDLGVVTEEDTIVQLDENGEVEEDEEPEELINEDGEVPNIPHQGTGDGGG